MNIFDLSASTNAVKLNETLNPTIWTKHEHLKNAVKDQILIGAEEYCSYLGLSESQVKDIVVSGESASFKYANNSPIDVVVLAELNPDPTFREFFNENKYKYNGQNQVQVNGHLVKFYVQPTDEPFVNNGSYSVTNESWVNVPRRTIKEDTVSKLKALESAAQPKPVAKPVAKPKVIKPQRVTYGFKTPTLEDVGTSWDGVSPDTKMFLSEQEPTDEEVLKDFVEFCIKELKIKQMPTIKLRKDPQWSVVNKTFGRYINDQHLLEVAFGQRHIMDVLRTVAHELTHKHQHERDGDRMGPAAGETGSPWENEANARAGILMRDYGRLHPELFDAGETELGESASGYIPTKKQANDPRWSMALTRDIKPGQLGREANKLKLKTDSQGHPQVANPNGLFEKLALELTQFKRKGTLAESEQLDEVRMAPSNLMQWAASPEAQGVRSGFEAELIFRDTSSGDDSGDDYEPDYDADERCRSIQQVIDFFENGEYGGLSSRQKSALQDGLDEQYMEWFDEQMYAQWSDERDELIKEAWLREKPMDERIHAFLVDGMDFDDKQADAIQAVGEKAPRFNSSKEQDAYGKQNPDYATYLEALEGAEEILEEDVEQTIEKQDGFYDEVLDEFRNGFYMDDDSGFFEDVNLQYMSDVANSYDLDWPYMTNSGSDNGGSRDWDEIGDSLNSAIDMPVKVSSGYHSATRKEGQFIVEPDSSLEPDDREDYGLEIVSPPMPLLVSLDKLQQVCDWANDPSAGNAYTNSSTGLHMGVSVPYKGGDVDYLKLVLFLGDEYVLKSFGREANTYTKSAISKFKENIKGGRVDVAGTMKLMQSNLIELAQREVQKGVGEGKYTSVHLQKGYIEFRSAGGDWLAEESADPEKLQNTMIRYAYAMSIAANPAAERREYAKKLYKLISPEGDSELALFSQYAAGELTAEQLKKRWAEKTLSKEDPKAYAKNNWVVIHKQTGLPAGSQSEYRGYTQAEVRQKAKEALINNPNSPTADATFDQWYSIKPMDTDKWEVYKKNDDGTEETLEIVDAGRKGEAVDKVYDKYNDQRIPFFVRAYYGDEEAAPEKELSPRAKLAKRITTPVPDVQWEIYNKKTGDVYEKFMSSPKGVSQEVSQAVRSFALNQNLDAADLNVRISADQPKQEPEQTVDTYRGKWEFFYAPTGRVLDAVNDASIMQARAVLADTQRRYNDLPADQIQMRKADAEQEPNVGQNFSANPNPTVQEPNQVRMPNGVPVWEVYERESGHVIHVVADHTMREAQAKAQEWLQGMNAEDPSLFAVRPKLLVAGERNLSPNISENFEDGKGPGRPGDSQRHGIPKGATIAELEKAAKAPGRKGQLARWQLNMRRGHKK